MAECQLSKNNRLWVAVMLLNLWPGECFQVQIFQFCFSAGIFTDVRGTISLFASPQLIFSVQ
jgi:hypothetical protein